MAETWITDITHFLDDDGGIILEPPQARKLGEYFAEIIVMSSYPEPEYVVSDAPGCFHIDFLKFERSRT